jgi:hypothetical protein
VLYKKSRIKSSYVVVFFIFSLAGLIIAKENERWFNENIEQLHVGNFALPVSQQPGPLFSFGQNTPEKGVLQIFALGNQLKGTGQSFAEIIPSILYGITDRLSIFVELPIAVKFKRGRFVSRGLSDLMIQLEGVVYMHETATIVNDITFVGNMTFPTGSFNKNPPTSTGSPRFFLGFTAGHSEQAWYYFTSMGGIITTFHKNNKIGNQFLYQFGLGRNIAYKTDTWIFNWLIELDGIYGQRSRIAGIIDPNSGGNTLLLGPSLWFSTQRFIIQAGILAVVSDRPFGIQRRNQYLASANIGWTF